MSAGEEVTRLLASCREGDEEALNRLIPLVYGELREIAHRQLGRAAGATLNTTAVVHEAYLRLAGPGLVAEDRHHFFNLAARAMRQILIDHARKHLARKRGGGAAPVLLDEKEIAVEERAEELVDLDAALDRLGRLDDRLGRVVELRFFAGFSVEETAGALGVGVRTVKRDWSKARAFLYDELYGGA